jgi:hypothetical protein
VVFFITAPKISGFMLISSIISFISQKQQKG